MKTNLQLTKTPIAKAGMLAPRQGMEGAPDVWLEVSPRFIERLQDIAVGQEIIVITWLHKAKRNTLKVHPRGDESSPLAGVFSTRSPDRPNPLGLHRVTVREIVGDRIRIGPMEAVDGTPVADVKPLPPESAELRNSCVRANLPNEMSNLDATLFCFPSASLTESAKLSHS